MIPAQFDYEVAESVDHAVSLLGQHADAKLLAGGHSLLPLMKLRLAAPAMLIDIGRLDDLKGVSGDGDALAIGALTCHADVAGDALIQQHCGVLADAAAQIGDAQVRHCGTIGGSVAHADPASDLPTVLLALDAELVATGPNGERTIPIGEFFQGFFESALADDEILTQIRVPKHDGHGGAYLKFHQRSQDWAIVGAAAVVSSSNGSIDTAKIALTNMAETPVRASAVEAALMGASHGAIASAAASAADGTEPPDDTFASADYRRHLAPVIVRRAVEAALAG
ncbi:MAG: xanthine dehydrogenase family protein subunit M [Thermoleophilia bacterium]|nr:xanthine dehydrogenase family protein subunit M [Thermoleophilia bacterium]MDH3724750.1 xanthine dehydrogenase family protein subunit M [Thermoleophilia bacterium]